jgi:hypothetical protein
MHCLFQLGCYQLHHTIRKLLTHAQVIVSASMLTQVNNEQAASGLSIVNVCVLYLPPHIIFPLL